MWRENLILTHAEEGKGGSGVVQGLLVGPWGGKVVARESVKISWHRFHPLHVIDGTDRILRRGNVAMFVATSFATYSV